MGSCCGGYFSLKSLQEPTLVRQIINIIFTNPTTAKISEFRTYCNETSQKIDILKMERPWGKIPPEEKEYLANLIVRNTKGELLEIIPERIPPCKEGYICTPLPLDPLEQKTVVLEYIKAHELSSKFLSLIYNPEFTMPIFNSEKLHIYLFIKPPPRLSIKKKFVVQILTKDKLIDVKKQDYENCGINIVQQPPSRNAIFILFKKPIIAIIKYVFSIPSALKWWMHLIASLGFLSIFVSDIKIQASSLAAVLVSRAWMVYEEGLMKKLTYLFLLEVLLLICAIYSLCYIGTNLITLKINELVMKILGLLRK